MWKFKYFSNFLFKNETIKNHLKLQKQTRKIVWKKEVNEYENYIGYNLYTIPRIITSKIAFKGFSSGKGPTVHCSLFSKIAKILTLPRKNDLKSTAHFPQNCKNIEKILIERLWLSLFNNEIKMNLPIYFTFYQ